MLTIDLNADLGESFGNYRLEQNDDLLDPPQALSLARRVIEIAPSSAAFWDTLALACYMNQDYIGALNSSRQAMKHLHTGDDVQYFEERLHYYERVFDQDANNE